MEKAWTLIILLNTGCAVTGLQVENDPQENSNLDESKLQELEPHESIENGMPGKASLAFEGQCQNAGCPSRWHASRILMFPVPFSSHVNCFVDIATELAGHGHHVDIAVPAEFQLRTNLSSDRIKLISYITPDGFNKANSEVLQQVIDSKGASLGLLLTMGKRLTDFCSTLLSGNRDFLDALGSVHYDIAVIDSMPPTKCVFLLPHKFHIPYISVVDVFEPWIARTPWLPSWAPNMVLALSDKMTFPQRLQNALVHVGLYFVPINAEVEASVVDQYHDHDGRFNGMRELVAQSQLWLLASDPLLDYALPLMPNAINVGGLSTKPGKQLPEDLRNKIGAFAGGFVLITFGSGMGNLSRETSQTFLDVFEKFDLLFIWRFENPHQLSIPDNVLLMKWVPQNDLLADRNIKLFVTHCGKNGLYEALYHGVPVLGMPLFGDQPYSGKVVETKQYGIILNLFSSNLETELTSAIRKGLDDPLYTRSIQKASRIFHNQRETPVERAAYWIEHVIEFGGDHLRSHAFELRWYEYLMLDIFAAVFGSVCCVLFIVYHSVKCVFQKCCLRHRKTN